MPDAGAPAERDRPTYGLRFWITVIVVGTLSARIIDWNPFGLFS